MTSSSPTDAAVLLRQADVLHISHDGRVTPHALTGGVGLVPTGTLGYGVELSD